MIINVKMNNLQGIKKEIQLSAIAINKIKREKNQLSYLNEKSKVLKSLCIIGCNGSGKTSFIRGLLAVQNFISFPFRKSINESSNFIEQIKNLPENVIKDILENFNTLNLPEQNIENQNKKTSIEIELFIPKRKSNISGIYKYTLEYDSNYKKNGILLEKLVYKEKYESKKDIEIFTTVNNIESEIGTSMLYENNIIKNYDNNTASAFKEKMQYYKSFGNEILYHWYFSLNQDEDEIDINKAFTNNTKRFVDICKLADDKIIDISIATNQKNNEQFLKFWVNKNNFLYFSQLSKGTKKILILANKIFESMYRNDTIIIDEIESALHPQLANFLVNILSQNNEKNYAQLIFTTHSPILAFTMKDDQLVYINNKGNDYDFNSINGAVAKGVISKDKNPHKAWLEGLLIKNPTLEEMADFVKKYSTNDK